MILALAPMEDVTDTVFRRIVGRLAKPDLYFTEFTNIDGLFSRGATVVSQRLRYTEEERPIIAQVWGSQPELFFKAAQRIVELGFDGMDINMGCPEKSVTSHGAGACLIDNVPLVTEIIASAKKGLQGKIPLSIKTRLGFKRINPAWIPFLLTQDLSMITIHGRTAAELSKVPAHWDEIAKYTHRGTPILGNGDVVNYNDAKEKCATYGVDGVMIGRGIFHDLWAFSKTGETHMHEPAVLRTLLLEHIALFDKEWGSTKNFAILKKFFKIYVQGFAGASELRVQLMACDDRTSVERVLAQFRYDEEK